MTETYSALRAYRQRIGEMLDDPECTGELLALGIALLDFAILRTSRDKTWGHYADRALGSRDEGYSDWRVRNILKRDIRRYDAVKDADAKDPARRCGAPMVRRRGSCGASASRRALLTDPDTGRKQWLAACRRHGGWFDARVYDNRVAADVEDIQAPPANTGGVLARHIPEIDWASTWRKLDPDWTPPPEDEPEPATVKPRLTLVLGGAS